MKNKGKFKETLPLFVAMSLLLLSGLLYHERFDLTLDKRYTLSDASKQIIAQADSPIVIDILLKGNFPPEFRRLQDETRQILEEFSSYSGQISYSFIDPSKGESAYLQHAIQDLGLTPVQVSVTEAGKQSVEIIYPWAIANYKGEQVKIQLLKNQLGSTSEERVNSSVQNLQYAFADGFKKLVTPKTGKVAVLKGNGELDDKYVFDFFTTLRDYYYIAPFTLDSVATNPRGTLEKLKDFDLIVVAKPTLPFTEEQKYVLDQYTMNGGKSLWLVDMTQLHNDPDSGNSFVFGMDLNLNDFFFRYGLRINPNLVKDVYSAPIVLASGEDRETQYDQYPWFYSPLSSSENNHPIVSNIEAVKFDFASAIDTLDTPIKKTILLSTSPITKVVGVPAEINFDEEIPKSLQVVNDGPDPAEFNAGEIPLAVLLEGDFSSVYKNRVKPVPGISDIENGKNTKMIVISDGDVIKNQMNKRESLELGYDKMTGAFYGNKEFLLNAVNYLLDDTGLINIRAKKISVPFLDPIASIDERGKFQIINLFVPLVLLGIFGIIFNSFRKRRNR